MVTTYVINMDKDVERLQHMKKILSKQNIQFQRIPAVNGKELPAQELEKYTQTARNKAWSSLGALGCFLSHRKAWENIAKADEPWGLVLEDDIYLSDSFKDYTSYESMKTCIPEDADIIRLETSTNRLKLRNKSPFLDRNLYEVCSTSWCVGAVLIKKETAQFLLKVEKHLWDSADYFLFEKETSPTARKLKIYQLSPALAVQAKFAEENKANHFKSNIEPEHTYKYTENSFLESLVLKVKKALEQYKRVNFQ